MKFGKIIIALIITLTLGLAVQSNFNNVKANTRANIISEPSTIAEVFPDAALAKNVSNQLKIAVTAPVTQSDLDSIKILGASRINVQSLEGIQYLNNLESLDIESNKITDLSPLDGMTNITELLLGYNDLSAVDITPITTLTNLKTLRLMQVKLTDFSFIENMNTITNLDLSKNIGIDLSSFTKLTNLEVLNLEQSGIVDVSELVAFQKLIDLKLFANKFENVQPLSQIPSLKKLHIGRNIVKKTIDSFTTLTNLEHLDISNNVITTYNAISEIYSLKYFDGSINPVKTVEPLRNLTSLEHLSFDTAQIKDIEPIKDLTNLRYLTFNLNQISDLTPLENLVSLETLHFTSNLVSDITPLENLDKLKVLWINTNKVSDLTPLTGLQNLVEFHFLSNKVSDISVFETFNTSLLTKVNGDNNNIIDLTPVEVYRNSGIKTLSFKNQTHTLTSIRSLEDDYTLNNVSTSANGTYIMPILTANNSGVIAADKTNVQYSNLALGDHSLEYNVAYDDVFSNTKVTYSLLVVQPYTVFEEYNVTYNANSATGLVPTDTTNYESGDSVTVLANSSLTKSDFTFKGWNTKSDGTGTTYAATDTFAISADTELFAVWSENFTVTYNGNTNTAGDAPTDTVIYELSNTVTILGANTLEKTGYSFVGWNTNALGTGTSYTAASTFDITADTELFAVWNEDLNVTYDGNGSTGGILPIDAKIYDDNEIVEVKSGSTLTKEDHTFKGWNTLQDGTGTTYLPTETFVIVEDTILYAIWSENLTLTYDGNGSTGGILPVDANIYELNDTVNVMDGSKLTRENYNFKGWNTKADGTGETYLTNTKTFAIASNFAITQDTILYAMWDKVIVNTPVVPPAEVPKTGTTLNITSIILFTITGLSISGYAIKRKDN